MRKGQIFFYILIGFVKKVFIARKYGSHLFHLEILYLPGDMPAFILDGVSTRVEGPSVEAIVL